MLLRQVCLRPYGPGRPDQVRLRLRLDDNREKPKLSKEKKDLAKDSTFSLNLLERIYWDDGQEDYDHESLGSVMQALTRFGDIPSIAEVYSVPRIAAQAMTVGMRPGFSIDIGTISPSTRASWNVENESEFKYLMRRSHSCFAVVRRATPFPRSRLGIGAGKIRRSTRR